MVAPAPNSVVMVSRPGAVVRLSVPGTVAAGRQLRQLSIRLNGTVVPATRGRDGRLQLRLRAADGLRAGGNLLRVEATAPGRRLPTDAQSRFTVAYPVTGLVSLSLSAAPGEPVRPRVQLPTAGIATVTVTLNGHDVTAALRRAVADGTRELELSAADLLHWGTNVVSVGVVMQDGRIQTVTRTVILDRHRAIAGVRQVGAAQVGRRVTLDAGSSLLPGGRLGGGSVRWTLVSKPARSHTVLPAHGTTVAWTPDAPGDYVVRVTVGSGASAGSALRTVTATYPQYLVPLDTVDGGSPAGLTVGPDRYVVSGALQVTVLDRASLQWLAGTGFDATSAGIAALGTYLKGLPKTDLVFVTHPSTSPPVSFGDLGALNNALAAIGGSFPGSWSLNLPACWAGGTEYCSQNQTGWYRTTGVSQPIGSFSIAGIPGLPAGQAWRSTAVQSHASEGRITGYLTHGVAAQTGDLDSYVINAGATQYAQVDTCASGGPTQCVIKVGDQSFAPTAGANGFNVVVLDRTTLAPITHVTATTAGQLNNALTYVATLPVGRQLAPPTFVDDQRIVVLQSVGTGVLPPSSTSPYSLLDYFGGTPELLHAALTTPGTGYAMVGVANDLPWHGTATESSPLVNAHQTGHVRTTLSRDRDWRYTPMAGDPSGGLNFDLYSVMYQPPTPWPYVGDPAIPAIAGQLDMAPDIRSNYPSLDTGSKTGRLAGLTCADVPGCGTQFSQDDFTAVQKQLLKEFDWVDQTKTLIGHLTYPFVLQGQSQPVDVQAIYDEIEKSINPPSSSDTFFDVLGVLLDVTNFASALAFQSGFDDAGVSLGLFAAAGGWVSDSITQPDGDDADVLSGAVNQLDQQFAYQELATVEALAQLQDVLVSDLGKVQTVGTKVGTDPAWNWDDGTSLSEAVTALSASTRSQSYRALLPAAWGMWDLKPDNVTQTSSDNVKTYQCRGDGTPDSSINPLATPFAGALPANQFPAVTSVTSSQQVVDQVWTFANIDETDFHYSVTYGHPVSLPGTSLTDGLTSTDARSGAFQYLPQWARTTYDPPGHVICATDESGRTAAHYTVNIPNADASQNQ